MTYARHHNGFTLIELVTVIVILGILAVFTVPRFMQSSRFESRTLQDQLVRAAQQAQQLAMNKGNGANVRLQVDNGNKRIRVEHTDGSTQIRDYPIPDGLTVTDATITYSVLGDATPPTTIVISGEDTRRVCIESTGYAHTC